MRERGRAAAVLCAGIASVVMFAISTGSAAAVDRVSPAPSVSGFSTPSGGGFWLAYSNGRVFGTGFTRDYGGPWEFSQPLNGPLVGGVSTLSGRGYWLGTSDGGVFSFGDARFHGSMGAAHLNQPVVGMTATADGKGYFLVAADGGVFSFGDARFSGSTGGLSLNQPIVGLTTSATGHGYRLVARDGGLFDFGGARFYGSLPGLGVHATDVVGMATTPSKAGYWIARSDGEVYAFGNAHSYGNFTASACDPVTGIFSNPHRQGYRLVTQSGATMPFGDAPIDSHIPANAIQCPPNKKPIDQLGGQLTLGGQIGPLQLGVSTEADVVADLGVPDHAEIGNIEVGDPDYRSLEYNCPGTGTTGAQQGPACRIIYSINLKTQTLAGFDTTSNGYETAEGTRVGMTSAEATRREGQPAQPESCLAAGIQLGSLQTYSAATPRPRPTIVIYVGTQPTDTVTELTAEDASNPVGLMEC